MGKSTEISWTRHSFNTHWGCAHVDAPGDEPSECDHCYAETMAVRWGWSESGANEPIWGPDVGRRFFGPKHWAEPLKWDHEARAEGLERTVFCSSMADVFEKHKYPEVQVQLDYARARLWKLIEATPNLIWLVLTKRPELISSMVPEAWMNGAWPANMVPGTSAGTQRALAIRVPRLIALPATHTFLSIEPLFEHVDLTPWMPAGRCRWQCGGCRRFFGGTEPRQTCPNCGRVGYWSGSHVGNSRSNGQPISWVIVGGESGPNDDVRDRVDLNLDAARRIRDDCARAGVPFHFKQVGGPTHSSGGFELDGQVLRAYAEPGWDPTLQPVTIR